MSDWDRAAICVRALRNAHPAATDMQEAERLEGLAAQRLREGFPALSLMLAGEARLLRHPEERKRFKGTIG